jgi:hypothetical protein
MKLTYLTSKRIWAITSLIVLDVLFFCFSNPNKVNSSLLIIGLTLLGVTIFALLDILFYALSRSGLNIKHRRKLALFLAIVFYVLIALQSIGQLTARDVIVLVPLGLLFYIYLTYIKVSPKV